jgi:hypothetical protein
MTRKSLPEKPKCGMTTEHGWNECHLCEALWPVGKPWEGWRPSMCVEKRGKVAPGAERALLTRLQAQARKRLKDHQEAQAAAWVKIKARRDARRNHSGGKQAYGPSGS